MSVKRLALSLLLLVPAVAHAEPIPQDNQMMFGLAVGYVPGQNNLQGDVALIGHYLSYSHGIGAWYFGLRAAIFYGWLPSGYTGQQYVFDADAFLGLHYKLGKPFMIRGELGSGPLLNGGEGFTFTTIDHTYVRAAFQWTVVKTVTVEAWGGPSFIIGPYLASVYPELGLGVGWNF